MYTLPLIPPGIRARVSSSASNIRIFHRVCRFRWRETSKFSHEWRSQVVVVELSSIVVELSSIVVELSSIVVEQSRDYGREVK